ncbi:tRNA(His) guanylyltransferase [Pyricularia oryzae Y34]|uniref:tRNA(His) guanylyltransferase n=2 Tax=Pyricularia oryzae TaxID=318829 RepID=A0AA97NVJ0_PYRO3|nr:tRNA(His) guanylyltransferase [Pyricularia oryzae Y34]
MNASAKSVVTELPEITIAYGVSDEYSFVFHKHCSLFDRRSGPLSPPLPSFDGRAVCFPSVQNLRDYMSWRQVDCHINNLYNTTYWALIQQGNLDAHTAERTLAGTFAADKNEILFSKFGINYNNELDIYKKGSVVFRDYILEEPQDGQGVAQKVEALVEPVVKSKTQAENEKKKRAKARVTVEHLDIIKDDFWDRRPWLLSNKPGEIPKQP